MVLATAFFTYTVYRDYEYLVVGTGKGKLLFYDAKTMKENPELLKEFEDVYKRQTGAL